MIVAKRNLTVEIFWKVHAWLYRTSGGKIGAKTIGMPVLLLTTTGRKSHAPRRVALTYIPKGDACVVIASNVGEPRHPGWWHNLVANPKATIQRGTKITRVRAREAEGEEREELWAEAARTTDSYPVYAERTKRRIPVVVLEPEETVPSAV